MWISRCSVYWKLENSTGKVLSLSCDCSLWIEGHEMTLWRTSVNAKLLSWASKNSNSCLSQTLTCICNNPLWTVWLSASHILDRYYVREKHYFHFFFLLACEMAISKTVDHIRVSQPSVIPAWSHPATDVTGISINWGTIRLSSQPIIWFFTKVPHHWINIEIANCILVCHKEEFHWIGGRGSSLFVWQTFEI